MTHAGIEPTESTYFAVMLVCRNNPNVGVARAMDVYEAMVANSVNGECFFFISLVIFISVWAICILTSCFFNSLAANVRFGARVQRTCAACRGGVAHQGRRRDRRSRHHTPHVRIAAQLTRQRGRGKATGPETQAHSHLQTLRGDAGAFIFITSVWAIVMTACFFYRRRMWNRRPRRSTP